jgi:hypothetical protein
VEHSVPDKQTSPEVAQALEEVQATLRVLVEQLGLGDEVRAALAKRKADRAEFEIERSLGQAVDRVAGARV